MFKRNIQTCLSFLIAFMLSGCMSTYQSDGIVISSQKIKAQNLAHPIQKGATIGGLSGAGIGAGAGGLFGVALINFGPGLVGGTASGSAMLGAGLVGAAIGGLALGIVGSAIGGGIGLAYHGVTYKHTVRQYQVRSLTDNRLVTIQQNAPEIPVNSRVRIFEQGGAKFIRR